MAFSHGKNAYFALGTSGSETTPTDLTSYLDDVSFPQTVDTADSSVYGVSSHQYVVGLKDTTVSLSGNFDPTADALFSALVGHETPLAFDYGPAGNSTGARKYSAAGGAGNAGAYVTSYEVTSPIGDVVGFSVELQITGDVTAGTFA